MSIPIILTLLICIAGSLLGWVIGVKIVDNHRIRCKYALPVIISCVCVFGFVAGIIAAHFAL